MRNILSQNKDATEETKLNASDNNTCQYRGKVQEPQQFNMSDNFQLQIEYQELWLSEVRNRKGKTRQYWLLFLKEHSFLAARIIYLYTVDQR